MMNFSTYNKDNFVVKTSTFAGKKGNGEIHAIVTTCDPSMTFDMQLEAVAEGVNELINGNAGYVPVFVRLLLSDAANQSVAAVERFKKITGNAAIAYIEQPPLHGSKSAAFVYLRQNVEVERVDNFTVKVAANGFTHFYTANCVFETVETYMETADQLWYLEKMLSEQNLNIADNCVRTWFYVQNIDVNYAAVVRARRDNFNQNGLTVDTHYISSTGICGRHAKKEITCVMDAYCVGGLQPGQMKFLYAADHLNRTSDYGVTFERGTTVDYPDRRHVIISGTASIDNKGNIVAPGDIKAQTLRMIENVRALLSEGGASFDDIAHIICYLRDVADYQVVTKIMHDTFGEVPMVITLAPVCRPGWLIEMECMAVVRA
jgi:enamine deaminase RidA (YjgF/YER057c/UK114 family)